MTQMKISLLENAYSFLNEALAKALKAESNSLNWKFSILNLVQAIELSLKEKLRQDHQILIYQNVDKPNYTVSLKLALDRLTRIAKVNFSNVDVDTINKASELRNNIVHFEFNFSPKEIKLVFAKLLGFLLQFHKKYLKTNLEEIIPEDLWYEAVAIFEYAEELYARAKERFEEEKIDEFLIWICKICDQDAFVIQDDINTCYVCGFKTEVIQCPDCEGIFYAIDCFELNKQDGSTNLLCKDCYEESIRDDEYYYHEMMSHFYNK